MKYKRYIRDLNKRKLYKDSEIIQRLIKTLEWSLSETTFIFFYKKLLNQYVCNKSYKSQIKNFCIFSGRSRAISRHWKVSRILLREFSAKGYFFGIKKSSW